MRIWNSKNKFWLSRWSSLPGPFAGLIQIKIRGMQLEIACNYTLQMLTQPNPKVSLQRPHCLCLLAKLTCSPKAAAFPHRDLLRTAMEHRADSSSSFQVQFLPPASPPHPLPRRLVSNLCQRWLSLVRSFSDSIIHSAISALLWNWTIISHSFFLCVVTYLEDILTTKTRCWIHFLSLCEMHAQMFISLSIYPLSIHLSIYLSIHCFYRHNLM